MSDRHIWGLDYLRAILTVFVVGWHTNFFSLSDRLPYVLSYILTMYGAIAAVPFFFQLSLYLYARKSVNNTHNFKKRLKNLSVLYIIWIPLYIVVPTNGDIADLFSNSKEFIGRLIGNHSVMYFLFWLIFFTIITEFVIRIREKYKAKIVLIVIPFLFSLGLMAFNMYLVTLLEFPLLTYANPLNFIPYVFSSILLVSITQSFNARDRSFYFSAFLVVAAFMILAVIEWILGTTPSYRVYLPLYNDFLYARVSLVFAGIIIIFLFSLITTPPPPAIRMISDLSLGIFLTHQLILYYFVQIRQSFQVEIGVLPGFAIVLSLAIITSYILKKGKYLY